MTLFQWANTTGISTLSSNTEEKAWRHVKHRLSVNVASAVNFGVYETP
nr:hypothetical protein OH820_25875 [Streptomyces sp. NBC_00857]